jgi:UDP-N-acetylglucosamine--N-acetylmuramyl-(pentapeptide) pyrophosphoryl-undecaprenol N-acetylglucosamine transferase
MAEAGAALVVDDSDLEPGELARRVGELLSDPGRVEAMAAASHSLARPDAAERIAAEVRAAAGSFSQ